MRHLKFLSGLKDVAWSKMIIGFCAISVALEKLSGSVFGRPWSVCKEKPQCEGRYWMSRNEMTVCVWIRIHRKIVFFQQPTVMYSYCRWTRPRPFCIAKITDVKPALNFVTLKCFLKKTLFSSWCYYHIGWLPLVSSYWKKKRKRTEVERNGLSSLLLMKLYLIVLCAWDNFTKKSGRQGYQSQIVLEFEAGGLVLFICLLI